MSDTSDPRITRAAAVVGFTLGALYFCYAFIQRVVPSIITNELMRDFAVGGAALGSLSAFYFWAYAGIQLPVGMLTDRFGPRKLMSFSAATCAVATVGFAYSDSLFLASFWRAIIGGSVAFGFVGTIAIAGYWFKPSRHAMLAGVLQGVGMLGAIFAQAPLRPIVEQLGWRHTMYSLAAVALILSISLYLFVPKRTVEQRTHPASPALLKGLKQVTSNPQSWLCALIGFGMASTMLSFSGLWAVPWFNTVHGYSLTQSAAMTSVLFIGWAVCSPIMGWLSDYIGRRNILMNWGILVYMVAFSIVVYATPSSTRLIIVLMFIIGGAGSAMTVCFIAAKEHNTLQYSSTAVGLMNMFVVGSGAVMQPLIGWLLDLNWSGVSENGARVYDSHAYSIAFSSLLIAMGAAFIGSLVIKETHCQQIRA